MLLLLSDSAPYMKKAGQALQALFPDMTHLTCLAHALHNISEHIRSLFPDVDKLISCGKSVFLKTPSRLRALQELKPLVPLPPKPVLTRWGTWINAALYWSKHFADMKEVIDTFFSQDAVSIRTAQTLLSDTTVQQQLAFISTHCANLPTAITSLESNKLPLSQSLDTFKNILEQLCSIPGDNGALIKKKAESVVNKNPGFAVLSSIANIHRGSSEQLSMDPTTITMYKYAPVTSVAVERTFSKYKHILSDRRQSFLFENLRKILILSCNQ